ncbi:MAG: hypothetical protein ACTHXA_10850 [Gulosibacter sp.]|uniref:hypothetical protein n=1 Tax=Gulosibacter sp. TaxID=2817531 RepID=UPI003F90A1CD
MARFRKVVNKATGLVPTKLRNRAKAVGKAALDAMPDGLESQVRTAFGRKGTVRVLGPADPLDLEVREEPQQKSTKARKKKTTTRKTAVAGRAAGAGSASRHDAPERLHRALFGATAPARTEAGGRPVAGILGRDLRSVLEESSHRVVPLIPGTARAAAAIAEVVIVDLAAFNGPWSGALDAAGVALYDELEDAITTAVQKGITTWVVLRGDDLHRLGALQLRRLESVEVVDPTNEREREHFTEDAGADAPEGIIDILRSLGGAQ